IIMVVLTLIGSIVLMFLKGKGMFRVQILGIFFGIWIVTMFAFYIMYANRKIRVLVREDIDLIWFFSKLTVLLTLFYSAMWFEMFEQSFNQKELILGLSFYAIIAFGIITIKLDPQEH